MLNHNGPVYYEQGCLKKVDYINTLVHCVQGQLVLDGCICEGIGISIRIIKYGQRKVTKEKVTRTQRRQALYRTDKRKIV